MTTHKVIPLLDELQLVRVLAKDTLHLIRSTEQIRAIKRLITAYDIYQLNLDLRKAYKGPYWDMASLTDLSTIRRELVVYFRGDFNPVQLLDDYSFKVGKFLWWAGLT